MAGGNSLKVSLLLPSQTTSFNDKTSPYIQVYVYNISYISARYYIRREKECCMQYLAVLQPLEKFEGVLVEGPLYVRKDVVLDLI